MIIILVLVVLVVVAIIITLAIVFTRDRDSEPDVPTSQPILPPPTAPPGADGPYKHAVVASDAGPCSEIGRDILKRGGTAMDSAVAALFCIGVYNMHSAGVGGGGFMVVYKKGTRSVEVIDFREEAPGKANRTMYVGGKLDSRIGKLLFDGKFFPILFPSQFRYTSLVSFAAVAGYRHATCYLPYLRARCVT